MTTRIESQGFDPTLLQGLKEHRRAKEIGRRIDQEVAIFRGDIDNPFMSRPYDHASLIAHNIPGATRETAAEAHGGKLRRYAASFGELPGDGGYQELGRPVTEAELKVLQSQYPRGVRFTRGYFQYNGMPPVESDLLPTTPPAHKILYANMLPASEQTRGKPGMRTHTKITTYGREAVYTVYIQI